MRPGNGSWPPSRRRTTPPEPRKPEAHLRLHLDLQAQDEALARRCLAGDQAAWQELVDRHAPLVLALCRSSGLTGDDASDVCQDVMVSAFRSLASYEGCRLSTWLYRIARRRIADYFRSPQRRHLPVALVETPPVPAVGGGSGSATERALLSAELRDAVARLDEPCRSIVVAYYLGEVPVREIAWEMSMAENTVKSHLHRARALLRKHMGESR